MFSLKRITQDPIQYLNKRFEIDAQFDQFNQRNDIFNRANWDDKVKPKHFFQSYDIANFAPKKAKGFDHWDYALRNASWHLTDVDRGAVFRPNGAGRGLYRLL
jgi:hypothetical protein